MTTLKDRLIDYEYLEKDCDSEKKLTKVQEMEDMLIDLNMTEPLLIERLVRSLKQDGCHFDMLKDNIKGMPRKTYFKKGYNDEDKLIICLVGHQNSGKTTFINQLIFKEMNVIPKNITVDVRRIEGDCYQVCLFKNSSKRKVILRNVLELTKYLKSCSSDIEDSASIEERHLVIEGPFYTLPFGMVLTDMKREREVFQIEWVVYNYEHPFEFSKRTSYLCIVNRCKNAKYIPASFAKKIFVDFDTLSGYKDVLEELENIEEFAESHLSIMGKKKEETPFVIDLEAVGNLRVMPKDILRLMFSTAYLTPDETLLCLRLGKSFVHHIWSSSSLSVEQNIENLRRKTFAAHYFLKKVEPLMLKRERGIHNTIARMEQQKLPLTAKQKRKLALPFNYGDYTICVKCLQATLKAKYENHLIHCKGEKKKKPKSRGFNHFDRSSSVIEIEGVSVYEEHAKRKCPFKCIVNFSCEFSTYWWCTEEMRKHVAQCGKKLTICTGCKKLCFITDQTSLHKKCFGKTDSKCPYCDWKLSYSNWDSSLFQAHQRECLKSMELKREEQELKAAWNMITVGNCQYCGKKFNASGMKNKETPLSAIEKEQQKETLMKAKEVHEEGCGTYLVTCKGCKKTFERKSGHNFLDCCVINEEDPSKPINDTSTTYDPTFLEKVRIAFLNRSNNPDVSKINIMF